MRLSLAVAGAFAVSVLLSAQNTTPVPNWPREAERPDTPKPKPAPKDVAELVGEYEGPKRTDGTAARLYLLEQDGQAMYIVDRGEIRPVPKAPVTRTRDGRIATITVDGVSYLRQQVGPEGSGQLRVDPIRPVADVLKESMTVPPPAETGIFCRQTLWSS
jgi:hypothetical protein